MSLTSLDISNFNTENIENMAYTFYYCQSLLSLDLSNFKTNNENIWETCLVIVQN